MKQQISAIAQSALELRSAAFLLGLVWEDSEKHGVLSPPLAWDGHFEKDFDFGADVGHAPGFVIRAREVHR